MRHQKTACSLFSGKHGSVRRIRGKTFARRNFTPDGDDPDDADYRPSSIGYLKQELILSSV